ncbi:MAG: hypothetical protein ACLP2Q_04705 [Steroidobacteraceae bacterium]
MSKAVRRYGKDGARLDSTYGSTGRSRIDDIDRDPNPLPASDAPRHVGHIGPPRVEVVGHDPSGSGKWLAPTHDAGLIGNAVETHPPLKPQGLSKAASGIGKASKVPAGKNESYRTRMDAGALAGESGERKGYMGHGRGKIRP